MSLQTQTNKISGVINFPLSLKTNKDIDNFINKFKSFCSVYREFYIIYHNRDIDNNGEFKTPHIHFLIDTTDVSDRSRLSTHLNNIASALNVDTALISLEPWRNYENAIQYLIHKNDKEKVLYKSSEIITNQTSDYLKLILDRELKTKISIDYLISLVNECYKISEIYQRLGIDEAKKYRHVIYDLWLEKETQKKHLSS